MVDAIVEGIKDRIGAAIKVNQTVGIQVPENRHDSLKEALYNIMKSNNKDTWTVLTASDSYYNISKKFENITEFNNINFIDCISQVAGISQIQGNCKYIESPTMLETISLHMMNFFKGIKEDVDKFIIIDSLSALMLYNDKEIVREFVSLLMNKTRYQNIHVITILIEEEVGSDKLLQMNDKIVVLRDSFIE